MHREKKKVAAFRERPPDPRVFWQKILSGFLITSLASAMGCAVPLALGPKYEGRRTSYEAYPLYEALGPRVAVANETGYLSYHAAVLQDYGPQERLRRVTTRSCISGLTLRETLVNSSQAAQTADRQVSFSWGTGGVRETLEQALKTLAEGEILSDIAFDVNHISILGIWRENCLVLNAAVSRPRRVAHASPSRAIGLTGVSS